LNTDDKDLIDFHKPELQSARNQGKRIIPY